MRTITTNADGGLTINHAGGTCCSGLHPEYFCPSCRQAYHRAVAGRPMPTMNAASADANFLDDLTLNRMAGPGLGTVPMLQDICEANEADRLDNLARRTTPSYVANRYAEGTFSEAVGGGYAATGTNPGAMASGSLFLSGPTVPQRGDGRDGSQYHDQEITRVPDGTGRVARIIAALDNLDDDEADELMDEIVARGDGRGVTRLRRQRADEPAPERGRDRGAARTPSSVYGGYEPPTTKIFGVGLKMSAKQRADTLPICNWDYEEWSKQTDDERGA